LYRLSIKSSWIIRHNIPAVPVQQFAEPKRFMVCSISVIRSGEIRTVKFERANASAAILAASLLVVKITSQFRRDIYADFLR
jgi:hypothetical protein